MFKIQTRARAAVAILLFLLESCEKGLRVDTNQPQLKTQPRMHPAFARPTARQAAKGRKFGPTPQDLSHSPLYCRLHRCQDGSASTNRLFHLGLPHSLKSSAFARPSSVVRLTPDYGGQDGATGIRVNS
jgi:hypothetical protein